MRYCIGLENQFLSYRYHPKNENKLELNGLRVNLDISSSLRQADSLLIPEYVLCSVKSLRQLDPLLDTTQKANHQ